MLAELSIIDFLDKTAGNEPVPGGGSISALNAALAAALAKMVTGLTIGKKKYEDREKRMNELSSLFENYLEGFVHDIDADSDAYNVVFSAFKLPKETEEEKTERAKKIQDATRIATEVPLQVAKNAFEMMEPIMETAKIGNQNAVTDACVAMMAARTAVLGALLNVRINLSSITDNDYKEHIEKEADKLETAAIIKEQELLNWVKEIL